MGKDGKKVAMLQNSCTSISTFLQLVSEQIKKEIRVLAPLPPPPPRNGEGGVPMMSPPSLSGKGAGGLGEFESDLV